MKSILLSAILFSSLNAFAYDPNDSMMGIDPSAIDSSANPCDDFYQYACGNWIKKMEMPADKNQVVRSFTEIYDRNLEVLHQTLEENAKAGSTQKDDEKRKLGDFYGSCMDEKQIEKNSVRELNAELAQINSLKTKDGLAHLIANLQLNGVNAFFSFDEETDLLDPTIKIASFGQGGMGLPDATYYTSSEASKVKLRNEYLEHLERMAHLLGEKKAQAKKMASDDYAIEEALAKTALTPEKLSDPTLNYHPSKMEDLKKVTPVFNWDHYLKNLSISEPKKVDLTEPQFLAALQSVLATTDLKAIQNYLRLRMIDSYAPYLNQKIYLSWFEFYGATLSGQKQPEPRWKRCVSGVGSRHGMGEALGKAFVEKTFSPKAKERAIEMITSIRKALKEDLARLDWLDDATRAKAQDKLEKITQKIGYPDKWKDYSKLEISRRSFLANEIAAIRFKELENLHRIGGPVDPTLWGMTPQTVNAYYAPDLNQINFPAGILQAPFFNEKFSDAANYGGIGMVIGHEITHGFDTVGSKFDGRGMMTDWWTAKVKTQFADKASCMKKQYSKYQPLPGLDVNGDLTITENIADNGGLKIAYAAYHLANPKTVTEKDEKDFFLSTAQSWCRKATEQALRRQVSSDPHSPAQFRINGSFQNSADFAKAYSCKDGTAMAPKNRCLIW